MATQRTVSISGKKLWTESLGDAANPTVLLICGAGAHAHFWTDTFCQPLVDAGFFLIRYDHRDSGLSDSSDADYELQALVDDAIGVLNDYNISKAHIVGHSMGGYIGQLMALSHPNRMLSLTCIASGPAGETEALVAPQTDAEKMVMHQTWLAILRNRPSDNFDESYEGFLGVWERLNGKVPLDDTMTRTYTQEMYTRSNYPIGAPARHIQVMQKMAETLKSRKEIFSQITLPTLLVHGEEDYLIPIQRGGSALAEKLPQAKLEVIPEMGHMLFDHSLETAVSEKIVSFLQSNSE